MQIDLEDVTELRFSDGSPVRAASAVARFGDGFLVAQDDATHGAWFRDGAATAVRLLPGVQGLETFEDASGTKHLKPDLEAACEVVVDGQPAVLLLGSGSSAARMRWSLLRLEAGQPWTTAADMEPLYAAVAAALSVEADALNLEGACVVGETLRWFHRGLPSADLPSGSVDLDLSAAIAAALGRREAGTVEVRDPRRYELGDVAGIGLAVTDAVRLAGDTILLSATAEDSPNPRDDGPVTGSALIRLRGHAVDDVAPIPLVAGRASKVEGLMLLDDDTTVRRLLAVVDVDDPTAPSLGLTLRVRA